MIVPYCPKPNKNVLLVSMWLMIPYKKEAPKVKNLISEKVSAINDVLATCSEVKTMILKQWQSTWS